MSIKPQRGLIHRNLLKQETLTDIKGPPASSQDENVQSRPEVQCCDMLTVCLLSSDVQHLLPVVLSLNFRKVVGVQLTLTWCRRGRRSMSEDLRTRTAVFPTRWKEEDGGRGAVLLLAPANWNDMCHSPTPGHQVGHTRWATPVMVSNVRTLKTH